MKGTNQSPPAYDFATDMQMCEEEKVKKNEGTNQDAKYEQSPSELEKKNSNIPFFPSH